MKGEVTKPNTGAFLFSGKGSCCQLVWITAVSRACALECALTLSDSRFASPASDLLTAMARWQPGPPLPQREAHQRNRCKLEATDWG